MSRPVPGPQAVGAERVTFYADPDAAAAALRGWTRTMAKVAARASVEPDQVADYEADMRGIEALLTTTPTGEVGLPTEVPR